MTNSKDDTLEELIRQRNELNTRIRRMKDCANYQGCAKLDREDFPTGRPSEWYIAINTRSDVPQTRKIWRSIIRSRNRDTVIKAIPKVIHDLCGLYAKLKDEVDDNDE